MVSSRSARSPNLPWKQLLGAVVRVKDDWDAVVLGHEPDVLRAGDGAEDGGLLVLVADALAGQEGGAAVRELNDDGRLDLPCSLQTRTSVIINLLYY